MKNTFKAKEEVVADVPAPEAVVPQEETAAPRAMPRPVGALLSFLNGSFLTREWVLGQLPFVLFLALIAMGYIANGYYAERMVKEINTTTNELKELRSEYITTKSDLMHISKQSEVAKYSQKIGLVESTTPPKKIVMD